MAAAPLEVADIFRRFGPAFRQTHAEVLGRGQLRAMRAIERCRTAALGGHVEQCDACGHRRITYNSCLMGSLRLRGVRMKLADVVRVRSPVVCPS